MHGFVALRWRPVDRDLEPRWRARVRALAEAGCEVLLDWRGIAVLAKPDQRASLPLVLPDRRGVVFGALFDRDAPGGPRIEAIDASESLRLTEGGGEALIGRYWGAYAAMLVDTGRDQLHAVACPSGALPLHHVAFDGGHAILGDASFLPVLGCALNIDVDEVKAFLRYPNRLAQCAAIAGVQRLLPGACITIDRVSARSKQVWTPPPPDASQTDVLANTRVLRQSLTNTCKSLASLAPRILHRLSGGLDSSVVLAALKHAAPEHEIIAVNDHGVGGDEGDERIFARIGAAHLGVRLEEARIDPEDVDYSRMLAMPLAFSPAPTLLTWSAERSSVASVGVGDALVTSGQGGDHLFYRGRGAMAPADAYRDGASLRRFLGEAMRAARRTRSSVWSLLPEAARMGPLGGTFDIVRHFRREGQSLECARATAGEHGELPWLRGWRKLPPGAVHRRCLLMDAQTYFGPSQLAATFAFAPPILFEPVVEALMRIPSYAMTADGAERGLVRRTYAPLLPPEIVHRRTKGQTTRFVAAIINRNRNFLADALSGGELETHGLIEREPVLRLLAASARADGAPPSALAPLICAELWLRSLRTSRERQATSVRAA